MTEANQQQEGQQGASAGIDPADLDLIDNRLEDEGKDEDALWDEIERAEAGDDDLDAHDDNDDRRAQAAEEDGGEGEGEDDGGEWASEDDGASSDTNTAQSDDKGASDGAQQDQGDELWSNATPEQRAAFEAAHSQIAKLEQADRSNRGRLSALQRQINELRTQSTSQKASAQQGADGKGQDQGQGGTGEDTDGFLGSSDWKSFSEEYPEVAGPLEKVIGSLQSHVTRQEKELSAIGAERRQSALDEQANVLAGEHPDWEDVTADQGFVAWLNEQPRHIQEAAYRNANEIVDAAEAADVVGRFKQYRTASNGGGNNNGASGSKDRGASDNRNLSSRRQRQLQSASSARGRGPGAGHGIAEDGDPETIWKQLEEQERRQQARGGGF